MTQKSSRKNENTFKAHYLIAMTVLLMITLSARDETLAALLPASPAVARPVPADYDGDGFVDGSLKGANGIWYIDVSKNGFGGRWDFAYPGYGGSTAVPVPADYDGDGKADLAVKDASGMWRIDYARNFFGVWDEQFRGYGGSTAVPVPAYYDDDRLADLSVKTSDGEWFIDYSSNGFNGWDERFTGYGGATAIPVPADYDGDKRADLAVKDISGHWHIDYSRDGFGAWNESRAGYGGAAAVPVPADYDMDGRTDLSVKDQSGTWLVDYAKDGFGAWNESYGGRGASESIALPGDYDRDQRLDLSVKDTSGFWLIDFAANGYGTWDLQIDNVNRMLVDTSAPWIDATEIYSPAGKVSPANGQYPLRIGVRYTVALHIQPGNKQYSAGVEVNADLHVPASLNLINRVGSTDHIVIRKAHTRRFALTCSQPGSFPLGFMMHDTGPPVGTGSAFNKDYGVRVECTAAHPGLYGVVTARRQASNGRFIPGPPIAGATVSTGTFKTTTASDGSWRLAAVTGGPHQVTVSKGGFSRTVAVNVRVPAGAGVQVDTPLEDPFGAFVAAGMSYTTFIDYSRGRTILHTVRVNPAAASVKLEESNKVSGRYQYLVEMAALKGPAALAMINGGYFNTSGGDASVGYFYSSAYIASEVNPDDTDYFADPPPAIIEPALKQLLPDVIEPAFTQPLLTISGTGTRQQIGIVQSEANFLSTTSAQWNRIANLFPIWDVAMPRDGKSDVDYAVQCAPFLLKDRAAIWRGVYDSGTLYQMAWARTAVGVGPGGVVHLVVADGEGVNGGNGATFNQLGEFFRDVLDATTAMNFDGGGSTQMVLRGVNGPRTVNTPTGEDSSWDVDPNKTIIKVRVFNYLMAGGG